MSIQNVVTPVNLGAEFDLGNLEANKVRVKVANSIERNPTTNALNLAGDQAAPGNNMVYGTSNAGVKGWQSGSVVRIADWAPTTLYSANQIVYYNNYLWRAITDFTSGATFNAANWKQIPSATKVTIQNGIPTVTPPASPKEGDHVVVTSDGTATGVLQSSWVYNGTVWVKMQEQPATVAVTSGTFRTYYPSYTAFIELIKTVLTAAQVTAYGFTAVGGATVAPATAVWNGMYPISLTATRAITPTTNFTIPTSYVRHEIAIKPGADNTYMLNVPVNRETCIEVWVCDSTTGAPISRLAAKSVSTTAAGAGQTCQLSPMNAAGQTTSVTQWVGFEIPKALVDANKTASDTIKLALRPGHLNGKTNQFYISGFAMVENAYGYGVNNQLQYDRWLNEPSVAGNRQIAWAANVEGMACGLISSGGTVTVRVPVLDVTKDLLLNVVQNAQSNVALEMHYCEFSLRHASGNVFLGRPNVVIKSQGASSALGYGHAANGWVIPAATVAAKVTTPANSAVPYLDVAITNPSDVDQYFNGFTTEYA